jgi:hypothetical protein
VGTPFGNYGNIKLIERELLLREADRQIGLLRRVTDRFTDRRQPERDESGSVTSTPTLGNLCLLPRGRPCAVEIYPVPKTFASHQYTYEKLV